MIFAFSAQKQRRGENEAHWASDIYGKRLSANAAAATTKDMRHRQGTALSLNWELADTLIKCAGKFENMTGKSLLEINY